VSLSIEEVIKTLVEAIALVFIVMLVFLQNVRETLITVPVVLLGTFGALAVFGFSITTLTMSGVVFAIGQMKDNVGICSTSDDVLPVARFDAGVDSAQPAHGLAAVRDHGVVLGDLGNQDGAAGRSRPFRRDPGPESRRYTDEVAKACVASYRTIFQKGTGNAELDAMNAAVAPKPRTFGIFNCEKLFTDVYDAYIAQTSEPDNVEARVQRMMTQGRTEYRPLPAIETERVRMAMRDSFSTIRRGLKNAGGTSS
jgi:hypothetical protein